jgi:hypothetical protein
MRGVAATSAVAAAACSGLTLAAAATAAVTTSWVLAGLVKLAVAVGP